MSLQTRLADFITAVGADIKALYGKAHIYLPFSVAGGLTVTSYTMKIYIEETQTITKVRASVGTAPTGSAIIVDVLKNGTTIFTTTANRPTIAASATTGVSGTPNTTSLAAGDYLTISVVQIGSTVAGSDLTVQVEL